MSDINPRAWSTIVDAAGRNQLQLRYAVDPDGYYLRFVVLERMDDMKGAPLYQDATASSTPVLTEDAGRALRLMSGSVKWDGCMDYRVGDERWDDGRMHSCGRLDALAIAEAIEMVYSAAARSLPHWDDGA